MLDVSKISTGFFADAKGGSIVHMVYNGTNKTVCKRTFRTRVFQWCSKGITFSYLECDTCKEIARRHFTEENSKKKYLFLPFANQSVGVKKRKCS
jgi:hypothetical protein